MSHNELVDAYRRGRISRRTFIRGMVALGATVTMANAAADAYAAPLKPGGPAAFRAQDDVYGDDDDGAGGGGGVELGRPPPDQRMHDPVEPAAGLGVGEHDRGQGRAVEGSLGGEHPGSERPDDGIQARRPGLHHLTGDAVGVDDARAPGGQQAGHGALARSDHAGQPDPQHARTVASARATITDG